MTPNGTCLKCGAPAFVLGVSVECSTVGCDNFNVEFATAQFEPLEQPEFSSDTSKIKKLGNVDLSDYYWIFNSVPGYHGTCSHKEGPPRGNFTYSKEDLEKHGAIGIYAKNNSGITIQNTFDPGCGILDKIEKDRRNP